MTNMVNFQPPFKTFHWPISARDDMPAFEKIKPIRNLPLFILVHEIIAIVKIRERKMISSHLCLMV